MALASLTFVVLLHLRLCFMNLALGAASPCDSSRVCQVTGLKCPDAYMDSAIDYTSWQNGESQYTAQGATLDGRCWYINHNAPFRNFKYMYFTPGGEGWIISGARPDLDHDDPWKASDKQVRLGYDLEGALVDARLYCGRDDGSIANNCSSSLRGDDQYYFWCENDGNAFVSCSGGDESDGRVLAMVTLVVVVVASCHFAVACGLWRLKSKRDSNNNVVIDSSEPADAAPVRATIDAANISRGLVRATANYAPAAAVDVTSDVVACDLD